MAVRDQTALIRRVIYNLKRKFGLPAEIVYQSSETVDYKTGRKVVNKQHWMVKRAILLPTSAQRDFVYALSFAAANRNFSYGGIFETGTRQLIIDRRDLPGVKIGLENWYIVVDHRRYEIKDIDSLDEAAALVITIKHLEGAPRDEFIAVSVKDRVTAIDAETT